MDREIILMYLLKYLADTEETLDARIDDKWLTFRVVYNFDEDFEHMGGGWYDWNESEYDKVAMSFEHMMQELSD